MANVIIIGAGAAGLFAAGTAAWAGHSVTVIEHMPEAGKKLLITGKGRCNVANNCDEEEFLKNVRRNPRFMFSSIHACPPSYVMALFENTLGVPLKTERGRRVFPQSDSAHDILNALLTYAQSADIFYNKGVKSLVVENDTIKGVKTNDGKIYDADAVIVATGGVSYPVTGSTGDGYKLAKQVGHTVITPEPSLVSLVAQGDLCRRMTGLSLRNINLSLLEGDKAVFSEQGEMLFTHFGVSGPLVLSASAHIHDIKKYDYSISIDLKPALSEEKLDKRITEDFALLAGKDASNALTKLLPSSMRPVMLEVWGVSPDKKINQITKEERRALVSLMKNFKIKLRDKGDLQHAVITSGGVNVKEVNPKTMESRICNGLYFAGEVLDVDAYTGGYNLGIAFATAFAAANHID